MTPSIPSGAAALTSRRAALGLALGAAAGGALGGCALNNPLSEEKTPAARAVRDLAPDVAVAVEAVTLLRGAETAVSSTGQQHPELAPRLADLLALHRAHLDAVVRAVPKRVDTTGTGPAYAVPPGPARALAQLRGSEQSLHDGLIGLAVRAQSGPFARLLGSMAAAVSQRLTGLAA